MSDLEVTGDGVDEDLAVVIGQLMADRDVLGGSCDESVSAAALWRDLDELGLTRVGVTEDRGGSGGTVDQLLTVLRVAARHGAPVPLAESYLGDALLAAAGLPAPETGYATTSSAAARYDDTGMITLPAVQWAADATCAAVLVREPDGSWLVAQLETGQRAGRVGSTVAGEPVADIAGVLADIPHAALTAGPDGWWWLGALCRTAQITGALESALRITRRYVSERVQFGKPVGSFQAVQHHVVDLAEATQKAAAALSLATSAWQQGARHRHFEVGVAKLVADEAARHGARAAHQAHGAIGMTREYPLHRLTTRLAHWQFDFGTEKQLAGVLGAAMTEAPSFAHAISDHDNALEVRCPVTSR